jgi:hypothetical protein
VALAGIDVYIFISVFSLTMDDVFAVERVVLVEWLVGSKAVCVDCHRLLFAVRKQESNRRFIGGFRRVNVGLARATISEDEHRWLVLLIRSTTARGQATRARLLVALAALLPRGNVQFVNLHWPFELWPRRVQRPEEALDAPVHRLVRNSEFRI